MQPRVSYVVANHNYGRYLAQAVDSILDQTFEAVEVIVVDDASTDDSGQVLERYSDDPRVRIVRQVQNQGHVRSKNAGLALARGEFVGIMDSDDYFLQSDAVSRLVDVFDANPDVGFVYSAIGVVDEAGRPTSTFRRWETDFVRDGLEEFAALLDKCYVPASGTLVRRSCHEQVGYYEPRVKIAPDWDLWLRLTTRYRVGHIADPLVSYRIHGTNMSHRRMSPTQMTNDYVLLLGRAFDALPSTAPPALRRLRSSAIRQALLLSSSQARRYGLTWRSWLGVLDAARRSPELVLRPAFHGALARCALLSMLGHDRYERMAARRQAHVLGGTASHAVAG